MALPRRRDNCCVPTKKVDKAAWVKSDDHLIKDGIITETEKMPQVVGTNEIAHLLGDGTVRISFNQRNALVLLLIFRYHTTHYSNLEFGWTYAMLKSMRFLGPSIEKFWVMTDS